MNGSSSSAPLPGAPGLLDRVLAAIESDRARHEAILEELLRFPSVSTDPVYEPDIARCAARVLELCRQSGMTAELVKTKRHPVVFARTPRLPGKPTVLFYGHYDVQPPDPLDLWESPPFTPTRRGENVYARGASDDKGQFLAHLLALAAWTKTAGAPPVNVIWVIEGEEEIGSPNLAAFLSDHAPELRAEAAVLSDTAQLAPGVPTICYGLRGLAYLELTVRGAKHDLHSGFYGGTVPNAAVMLSKALASLHDAEGRVLIPGFYDRVRPLSETERAAWAALPFDEAALADYTGGTLFGEPGYSTLERRWARPTCDINGFWGGYRGPGAKTVLPAEANAKISCRLVPDQDPDEIVTALENHLRANLPSTVSVTVRRHAGSPPALVDPAGPIVEAGKRALKTGFGAEPVLTREGGTIPVVGMFERILGIPTLMIGLGRPDDNLHAPNEKFHLGDFHAGIRTSAALLAELASSLGRS